MQFIGDTPEMNTITLNNQEDVCFMAKEAAPWVVIIRLTLPISKGIYAEVSKTSSMFYALVMNTVKLCIRQKNRCSPSAM